MFIMIDGIDGSGKSTIIKNWEENLKAKGLKIFNLTNYCKENVDLPKADSLLEYNVIISGEPTHTWFGRAIRYEITQQGANYSANTVANAFALDRLVLYKRVLMPLLQKGKIILQDRGVSTSLCYQPLQDGITMDFVASLEGNEYALKNAPNYLVIADLPVDIALKRIDTRYSKQDDSIFENKTFLEKARAQFLDPEYQKFFTTHNTHIEVLNTNNSTDIIKEKSNALLERLLTKK